MNCENCGIEHDGSYGSGRFCGTKCSRGFSTKAKRKEINEKVSKTFTIKRINDIGFHSNENSTVKKDKKRYYCNYCGSEKGLCNNPNLCKKHKLIPSLEKYFGFDVNVLRFN